jgi:hypothetical protein
MNMFSSLGSIVRIFGVFFFISLILEGALRKKSILITRNSCSRKEWIDRRYYPLDFHGNRETLKVYF